MKKWIACVGCMLLAVQLTGCIFNPGEITTDPTPTPALTPTPTPTPAPTPIPSPEAVTAEVVLSRYRLKIPEDWKEASPVEGDENLQQFLFTDNGKPGDCVLSVVQPANADSPGIAASYLQLMSRFLDTDEVAQETIGEWQFSFADFQMNNIFVSVAACQLDEDLLLIFIQGLDDVVQQREIAKALASTLEIGM